MLPVGFAQASKAIPARDFKSATRTKACPTRQTSAKCHLLTPGPHRQRQRRQQYSCAASGGEKEEGLYDKDIDRWKKRQMEDELRDPRGPFEYLLPRPVRRVLLGSGAVSCLVASALAATQLIRDAAVGLPVQGDALSTLAIDLAGFAVFGLLFSRDAAAAERRIVQRQQLRQRQIEFGDREVFFNEEGEKMSKLREVDADWVLRRLERWGKRDNMPFIGPKKGAILQRLVREKAPRVAAEVGTMCGYSAVLTAQALPPGGHLTTIEKDWLWVLSAKRFLWQARCGREGSDVAAVDVRWGDATAELPKLQNVEFLFLDGTPKETLAYLRAAEPHLAPGALVVADNAVVFRDGGMRDYLNYVRGGDAYKSRTEEVPLEWRDDVADGLEVSVYRGGGGTHNGSSDGGSGVG